MEFETIEYLDEIGFGSDDEVLTDWTDGCGGFQNLDTDFSW